MKLRPAGKLAVLIILALGTCSHAFAIVGTWIVNGYDCAIPNLVATPVTGNGEITALAGGQYSLNFSLGSHSFSKSISLTHQNGVYLWADEELTGNMRILHKIVISQIDADTLTINVADAHVERDGGIHWPDILAFNSFAAILTKTELPPPTPSLWSGNYKGIANVIHSGDSADTTVFDSFIESTGLTVTNISGSSFMLTYDDDDDDDDQAPLNWTTDSVGLRTSYSSNARRVTFESDYWLAEVVYDADEGRALQIGNGRIAIFSFYAVIGELIFKGPPAAGPFRGIWGAESTVEVNHRAPEVKLFGPICDTCPPLLQETNQIHPGIFRYSGNRPDLRTNHQLMVKLSGPPNTNLRVYVQPEPRSGGHDHDDTPRPHGYLLSPDQNWRNTPPLDTTTVAGGNSNNSSYETAFVVFSGPSGTTNLYYIAPEISGEEWLIVSTEAPSPSERLSTTNQITVAVPALQELPSGPTIVLEGDLPAHQKNHFGTADMIKATLALATNYFAKTRGKLPVNDISLPQGGMFDIGPPNYGPFWNYKDGKKANHFGHRVGREVDISIPSKLGNAIFERIIQEQGWWLENSALWKKEGNHYHLNLAGTGRVTISDTGKGAVAFVSGDTETRTMTLGVTVVNRGGLDAGSVSVQSLTASNGVHIAGPATPFNLSPMPMPIQSTRSFNVECVIPEGCKAFFLRWTTLATSPDSPGQFDNVITNSKPVKVQFTAAQSSLGKTVSRKGPPITNGPQPAGGDWSITILSAHHEAVVGTNLVYDAIIQNDTGDELFLSDLSLWFRTPATKGTYALDWSPEFLDTGGLISTNGYTGPLVTLRWLSTPPAGAVSVGEIELVTDDSVLTPVITAEFSSGLPAPSLSIAQADGGVTLSWPADAEGLWIETATVIEETEWIPITDSIITMGGTNYITMPITDSTAFFRLMAPWFGW